MQEPDSLDQLPLLKHHCTHGRRKILSHYTDVDTLVDETSSDMLSERIDSDDYGPGTPCSHCGETIDGYSPPWTEYCYRHVDERVEPIFVELRELVERWREHSIYKDGYKDDAWRICASELEELIDDD